MHNIRHNSNSIVQKKSAENIHIRTHKRDYTLEKYTLNFRTFQIEVLGINDALITFLRQKD